MKTIITVLLVLLSAISYAQFNVCGTITDENNAPLIGVNVMEKGASNGKVTDFNGKYCIAVKSENAILAFSFIGYERQEIEIKGRTEISLSLVPSACQINEIVVVGKKMGCDGIVCLRDRAVAVTRISAPGNRRFRKVSQVNMNNNYYNPPVETNESYAEIKENGFKNTGTSPLSTFSIDVDRASYSNIRRFINLGQKPPDDAVRIEEMINYFSYDYPQPQEHPVSIYSEVSDCPWNSKHLLMQVAMKAKDINEDELPPSNLVFLVDVSGSMSSYNKLPLVKSSMHMLVDKLREDDRVAIVVYAGAAGLVLPSTKGSQKDKINKAIDNLNAGGSTAGGAGIKLAYSVAEENFKKKGNNRIILATDGDFNVGASSDNATEKLITAKRKSGIYLTCLGYGMGNYKDSKMEILADKGNGNYAYIDNILEAEKTLIEEFGSTMYTVAKDVKIQIEFNPEMIKSYRLVGYENRLLNDEDFKDDKVDAGEVGAGHTVTALYELIPAGTDSEFAPDIDDLKYQSKENINSAELATVKVRYKLPDEDSSIYFDKVVAANNDFMENPSENFRFASSVAMFGMMLTKSEYIKHVKYNDVVKLASESRGKDKQGYRAECIRLMKTADKF